MALKLSIGFQKKIGLPDYGSAGATCQVEFEVDHSLIQKDLEGFHDKARHAFVACQQAVNDQLARQTTTLAAHNGHSNGHGPPNGSHSGNGATNGNGRSARLATQSQARALRAIASKQRVDLVKLLESRFHVARPEDLRLSDASGLIDELKSGGST